MNRLVATLGGLAAMLAASAGGAQAQSVTDTVVGSCVYAYGMVNCVRQFRYGDTGNKGVQNLKEPSEEQAAESRERERQWVARCQPALRQDGYGVSRYQYAAQGCEYGKFED
jgi:hypothetical protein